MYNNKTNTPLFMNILSQKGVLDLIQIQHLSTLIKIKKNKLPTNIQGSRSIYQ